MNVRDIEKLDIAREQLDDALEMYFGQHYHSAIVLAGAAEQLLAGYVMRHGGTPEWKRARSSLTKISNGLNERRGNESKSVSEKEVGDIMNRIYNNSKHAGKTDHTLKFDPKFEAQQVIDRALMNFQQLSARGEYDTRELSLAQRFVQESADEVTIE